MLYCTVSCCPSSFARHCVKLKPDVSSRCILHRNLMKMIRLGSVERCRFSPGPSGRREAFFSRCPHKCVIMLIDICTPSQFPTCSALLSVHENVWMDEWMDVMVSRAHNGATLNLSQPAPVSVSLFQIYGPCLTEPFPRGDDLCNPRLHVQQKRWRFTWTAYTHGNGHKRQREAL